MSDLFAMTDSTVNDKLAAAANNSVDSLKELESPLWRGTLSGPALGVMRGFAKVADTLGITLGGTAGKAIDTSRETIDDSASAASAVGNIWSAIRSGQPERLAGGVQLAPDSVHTEAQDAIFSSADDTTGSAVDYWTPRPNEVGRVGQVLGGLGEVGAELVAGVGTPYALVATSTAEGGKDLVDQGVDAGTAGTAAALEGAASYAGLKIPIVGSTLPTRLVSGAAGNVAFGAGSRAAEKALLESQGYETQAKPFTTDLASVSTDALTGVLFGGLHHALAPRINPKLTPAQADALLTARNAKNFQDGTPPGKPADVRSDAASQEAAADTLERLSRGNRVDVGDIVAKHEGASFTPDGKIEESVELAKTVEQHQADEITGERQRFPQDKIAVEESDGGRFLTIRSPGGLTEARVSGGEFLQVTNTETELAARSRGEGSARMLRLLDVAQERGLTLISDTKVSDAAARFYERADAEGFDVIRNDARPDGEGNLISESGKPVFEVHPKKTGYDLPHEEAGQFKGLRSDLPTDENVGGNRAGASGDSGRPGDGGARGEPLKVFRGGVAELSGKDFERGSLEGASSRPVLGLGAHFTNTAERAAELGAVTEHHLDIQNPAHLSFEDLPRFRTLAEYRKFADDLRAQGHDGVIVDASHIGGPVDYFAFNHEQVKSAQQPAAAATPEVIAKLPPEQAADTFGDKAPPHVAALRQLAAERPDAVVYSGRDEDGQPIKSTVAAEYERVQREYEREIQDTKAYEAAVTCFLGRGA